MTNSVYVSYSWSAEKQNPVVDALSESCRDYGLDFRRDIERLNYGNLIRAFMDEIGSAGNIIPVFSRNYFESEYCMYELLQVWKNGEFHKRIHPIALGDIRLDDEDFQLALIDYWGGKTKELRDKLNGRDPATTQPLQERNTRYAAIYADCNDLIDFVSNMNLLTLETLRQQNFLPLLNRIQPKQSEAETKRRWYRKPDAQFQGIISEKIREILDLRGNLRASVHSKSLDLFGSGDPLDSLCKAEPATAINDVLRPAIEQCLCSCPVNSDDYQSNWEAAKSILGWLSLFSVSSDWIEEQEKSQLRGIGFEIMVKTPCGVEIVSSRFRQIPPKFYTEPDKSEVYGQDAITYHLETGWDENYTLDRLILEIWNRVFPKETRTTLSAYEIAKLNSTLKILERNKVNHYYIPVNEGEATRMADPKFCEKLLGKLKDITIIRLKATGGKATLQVEDEYDLMTIIREFLNIPHQRRQ